MSTRRDFLKGLVVAAVAAPALAHATHDLELEDCDYDGGELVVEGEGYSGISIMSPREPARIYFGDPDTAGYIQINGQTIKI